MRNEDWEDEGRRFLGHSRGSRNGDRHHDQRNINFGQRLVIYEIVSNGRRIMKLRCTKETLQACF